MTAVPASWPGDPADLRDEADPRRVVTSELLVHGRVWDVRRDCVDLGDGQRVARDVVVHPGAVAALALDDDDRVLLIRQYRHPVGMLLWEPPAGLLDVPGEDPAVTVARELVEEAGVVAARWDVLFDYGASPGGSSEGLRVFLARGLAPAPGGRPPGDGEERDLPLAWVPLDQARDLVLAGRLTAPMTVAGVLAAWVARELGWSTLRPVGAPWPMRETALATGRVWSG